MTGVLAGGQGSALATLLIYILIFIVPIIFVILGIRERKRGTADGKRVATAMFGMAGLVFAAIVAFIVFTALY